MGSGLSRDQLSPDFHPHFQSMALDHPCTWFCRLTLPICVLRVEAVSPVWFLEAWQAEQGPWLSSPGGPEGAQCGVRFGGASISQSILV